MESAQQYYSALADLDWQVSHGIDETIGDVPVNRYEVVPAPKPAKSKISAVPVAPNHPIPMAEVDPVAVAQDLAKSATDLTALQGALQGYDHCELKRGARSTVFGSGNPDARVMIIGEAPGREEDRAGTPYVGAQGQLLNKMLAAIDLGRDQSSALESVYITNIIPWRPPQKREPTDQEIAMMMPFVRRHIELVAPDVLVLMGKTSCQAMLGKRGITRLRGQWADVMGRPAIVMFDPVYLMRTPSAKSAAWADLLALKARLKGM